MILPIFSLLALTAPLLAQTPSLVVMRHGDGEHVVQGVFSTLLKEEGGVDNSLTIKGRTEVKETAQRLLELGFNEKSVSLVLVSPMQRTQETAQILVDCNVCSQESLRIDARIREPLAKAWEGKVKKTIPEFAMPFSNWVEEVDVCGRAGGETSQELLHRVESVMQTVSELDPMRGHIIFVTHGAIASVILSLHGSLESVKTAEAKIFPFPQKSK
jgi:broad specificity phosphatase PhoE